MHVRTHVEGDSVIAAVPTIIYKLFFLFFYIQMPLRLRLLPRLLLQMVKLCLRLVTEKRVDYPISLVGGQSRMDVKLQECTALSLITSAHYLLRRIVSSSGTVLTYAT